MRPMNLLNTEELKNLMGKCGEACVSIYMPTHVKGLETQQDPIRLKNLVKQAEELLLQKGLRSPEVKAMVQPALDLVQDGLFWSHQSDGLAVFLSADHIAVYALPFKFEELAVVSDRFHLKPLLPLLSGRRAILRSCLEPERSEAHEGPLASVSRKSNGGRAGEPR